MAAWRSYVETVVDLNAALEADLAPHGLTLGDYQVLVYLSEADDHDDADVRPGGAAAAVAERAHPPARRARARRAGRAAAVATDRRVMLAVLTDRGLGAPRTRSPRSTSRACAGTSSTASTGATSRRWPASSGAIRDRPARRRAGDRLAPAGLRLPRRQRRRQGRHRRLRRHRRRPAGRRRRGVHAQPVRRPERDDQPRAPRRRAGAGRSSSCRRTPTSPTARPAAADAEAARRRRGRRGSAARPTTCWWRRPA